MSDKLYCSLTSVMLTPLSVTLHRLNREWRKLFVHILSRGRHQFTPDVQFDIEIDVRFDIGRY